MSRYIYKLLRNGESQHLDYKQSITDAAKIAKTISAFANGDGGILLIGVKDNRRICGVRNEDERYMFDLAARFYCKPAVDVEVNEHAVEGKIVLECIVHSGKTVPYYAKSENDQWLAYMRVQDQTLKAGYVAVEVMKRKTSGQATFIVMKDEVNTLLQYLTEKGEITLNEFRKLIGSNRWFAAKILVNLISTGIVSYNLTEKKEYFTLK